MGWLPRQAFLDLKAEALALTEEERNALTWETARRFVTHDTLDMARWYGLSVTCDTPWEAVCILRGIE